MRLTLKACTTLNYSAAQENPHVLLAYKPPMVLCVLACTSMQVLYRLLTSFGHACRPKVHIRHSMEDFRCKTCALALHWAPYTRHAAQVLT